MTATPPVIYVHDTLKWQYKRWIHPLAEGGPPPAAKLDEFGARGWELAGIVSHENSVYCYFKRPAD